jgi:signal transduction histidine kinase
MEDILLKQAMALYKDRLRIVLAAFIFIFAITFYLFYSPEIISLGAVPPAIIDSGGWTQGFAVVASVNTIGFFLAIALMALIFKFWSWAFLPGPASTFTLAVLRGILGSQTTIKHSMGKRFRVTLENGLQFDVNCKIKEKDTGDWFAYRLVSTKFQSDELRNIALRHGFGVKDNRLVANISNDELHLRTFLLTKAMMMIGPSI